MPITEAQLHVLAALDRLLKAERMSPSLEELARESQRSHSTTAFHFRNLREGGYISTIPGRHRSMGITRRGRAALRKGE